jgi:hypothetical protein
MKRLFTIAVLTISLLALLAACGNEATPTANPGPASSTAQELKQAAQELWDTFTASIQALDAAALHGIFVADLRERCTVEQMQKSLASDGVALPNAEVRTVYLDLGDPSNALMQLAMLDQPEGNLEVLASSFIFAFPLPMAREEGEWRLSLSFLGIAPEEGCPFAEDLRQSETVTADSRQMEATPQPAFPRLAPPPGGRLKFGGSGGSTGEYNASVLLETDMTLVALLEHYRQQVLQPDWKVRQETMGEGLSALTWTLRDEADHPWFGVLLITSAEEGMWVRLWMAGGAGVQTFVFPEGPEPPVPAATSGN